MAAVLIIVMSIWGGGGINSCDFLSSREVFDSKQEINHFRFKSKLNVMM